MLLDHVCRLVVLRLRGCFAVWPAAETKCRFGCREALADSCCLALRDRDGSLKSISHRSTLRLHGKAIGGVGQSFSVNAVPKFDFIPVLASVVTAASEL